MPNSRKPKDASYARYAVDLTASNPNAEARRAMARAAVSIGNYTDAGRAVWSAWLAAGCPQDIRPSAGLS